MARDGSAAAGPRAVIEKLRNIVEWSGRKFVMGAKKKTAGMSTRRRRCRAKTTARKTCAASPCPNG